MQYRRISADCHLDMPWMPPDLFVSEARRELKDRMPYVEDGPQGPQWVAKNGANFGLKNGVGPGGAPFVPGQNHRVDKMAETGMYEDGKKDIRRCSDPHLRIKDMDRDGVDAEVIYGILGAASRLNDREASNEMLRIYNNWLKEFCSHYPERQIGLACLPYGDIDEAVEGDPSGRQDGHQGARTVLLLGHGADVAPGLGAAVEGGRGRAIAVAFPYLPDDLAPGARGGFRPDPPGGDVYRRLGLPDGPDQHHRGADRRRRAGAPSAAARVVRRERHRLASLCARPHGFRV